MAITKTKYRSGTKSEGTPQAAVAKSNRFSGSISAESLAVWAVIALFFASGFSSLIYQVVWTRISVLVFGATTFATASVLAIFMGGLALGSFLAGRLSDRIQRPLLWYGILEAVVGLWALATPALFNIATPLYKQIWLHTHASAITFAVLRFAVTSLILIVPTSCMGATLPLLARHVTRSLETVGSRVGTLYSINTLGAILGAVYGGFVLIPDFGMQGTIGIAALINGGLLSGALLLSWLLGEGRNARSADQRESASGSPEPVRAGHGSDHPVPTGATRLVQLALIAFAVSGGVAMIYEVCWTRTLLMVIGSSTYAFTIMLCAFLTGIFAGSLICARLVDKAKSPLLWFAALQLALGALTFVSMRMFNFLPFWNLQIGGAVHLDPNTSMLVRFLLAGSILVPITLCLGAIFPAAVKACACDLAKVGRSVGSLYAANTLGAIVGSFLAGFILLPWLGAETTLVAGACVNTALGIMLLWSGELKDNRLAWIGTAGGAAAALVLCLSPGLWDKTLLLNTQSYRRAVARRGFSYSDFNQWKRALDANCRTLFWKDGACSNVGVIYHKDVKVTSLLTNGHIDASDGADMPVQALIAGFPLLLNPDAKEVAVVGWGCGQTVGTASLFPVHSIEAVELEPAVVEASRFFHHVNHAPESNPKVHLLYNDGRNYLLTTDKKYDVIMSEPSNPWQSGVCNLFTREYFNICHERLRPHGVLALWVQISEVPPRDLCGILAALNGAFKHSLIFCPLHGNLVLLASDNPIKLDVQAVMKALGDKRIAEEMRRVGITSPGAYLGRLVACGEDGKATLSNAFVNCDDKNNLEFDVAKSYEDKLYVGENEQLLAAMSNHLPPVVWGNVANADKAEVLANAAEEATRFGGQNIALAWVEQSLALQPTAHAYRTAANVMASRHDFARAAQYCTKALELDPSDAELYTLRGSVGVLAKDPEPGRADLRQALALRPTDKLTRYLLAGSYGPKLIGLPYKKSKLQHDDGSAARVLELLGTVADDADFASLHPNVLYIAAQAHYKLSQFEAAKKYLDAYLRLVPDSALAKNFKEALDIIADNP